MTFLLRQISHSAEGREIVRPSRVEGERLTIGRSPECDIHLTDLAVALHHATIERAGERLALTTEKGLYVELNGRKSTQGSIDINAGGDIRIASHLIRILPKAGDSAEISVDIERTGVAGGKSRSAERMFSLASVMPSKRAAAWGLIGIVLALFLAWPIKGYLDRQQEQEAARFHADEMWSSGKLSLAHTSLENDCQACHVKAFEAVTDAACKDCHTGIHDHADPFRLARAEPDLTTWGKVELAFKETFDIPPGRCVECHTEHEGATQMAPTAQRFCSDCHTTLRDQLPDTKLANAGDFGTDHPEFQPAFITRWDGDRPVLGRASLARNPREDSNLKFPHDSHLSKTGGVAQMARRLGSEFGFGDALACKDCHDATPDGVRFQPVNMEADCAMCHSLAFDRVGGTIRTLRHGEPEQVVADLRDFYRLRSPASRDGAARRRPGQSGRSIGSVGAAQAIRAVFSPGGACYDCHQVEAPPPGSLAFDIRPVAFPVRYMHKGWFDHKPHEVEECTSCHLAETSGVASDLLLPDLASCRECHGGESARAEVPSGCAMCHDYHMDEGAPSMLIRQKVGGKKKDTVIADTATLRRAAAERR
jgi:hypothetical protein